jgi:small nuclear ribonucleoprotein G
MTRTQTPELKRYLDKRISLQLNGGRKVVGVLRGFDPFMNIVLEDSVEVLEKENKQMGSIVGKNTNLGNQGKFYKRNGSTREDTIYVKCVLEYTSSSTYFCCLR